MAQSLLLPDLTWHDGRFVPDRGVVVDDDAGTIRRVGPAWSLLQDFESRTGPDAEVVRLPGRALLPGFVNAHSHAFQRLIRGRTQWRPANGERSDFWSWREAMYSAALELEPDDVHVVSRFCFLEMLHAGITSVGEFHYLHRSTDWRPYRDPNELAHRVIAAAEEVGVRITLLNVCYATGGIGAGLSERQSRFATPELAGYLSETLDLQAAYSHADRVGVGLAPHSIRAVPREWLPTLAAQAAEHAMPLHMHVAEQPAEVEESVAAFGMRPVEVLEDDGILGDRFTAVHATHLVDSEAQALGAASSTVCACPTTERDLGDGFLPLDLLRESGVPIALGSDSQTVIHMLEEARLVEYHERLRRRRRAVVTEPVPADPERLEVGPPLLDMATRTGARSLALDAGVIAPGKLADLTAMNLEHPAVAGWTPATLPALLALSAPPDVVRDVWVGGVRRLEDGAHELDEGVAERTFTALASRFD